MQAAERKLLSLLMPERLLEYFQIKEVDKVENQLHIYLDELNTSPAGYENSLSDYHDWDQISHAEHCK